MGQSNVCKPKTKRDTLMCDPPYTTKHLTAKLKNGPIWNVTRFSMSRQDSKVYLKCHKRVFWKDSFLVFGGRLRGTKIQNDHLYPENQLNMNFVLTCIINNVVLLLLNTTFTFITPVEQIRVQAAGRRWIKITDYVLHWWQTYRLYRIVT